MKNYRPPLTPKVVFTRGPAVNKEPPMPKPCRPKQHIPDLTKPSRRWKKARLYRCQICGHWFSWRPPKMKVIPPKLTGREHDAS